MKKFVLYLNLFRIIPSYLMVNISKEKNVVKEDVLRWKEILKIDINSELLLIGYLLMFFPEFRNLLCYRMKKNRIIWGFMKLFWKELPTLNICCLEIGGGLFIQHGFATIISAESIGKNCWINQQVTIGYKENSKPTIKDNVRICAGAKVLGEITMENNSVAGANAVVVHDVPANAIVVGVPAKIIKYNQ